MVIVEGPDGAGKSTLINTLCAKFNTDIMPRACTSDNGVDVATLRKWVDDDLRTARENNGLYDRHPLVSEPIYGPLVRGEMAEGFCDPFWLMKSLSDLKKLKPTYIMCLPPWLNVESNIEHNHAPTTQHLRKMMLNARAIYDAYVFRTACLAVEGAQVWVWDYTEPDAKEYEGMMTAMERELVHANP